MLFFLIILISSILIFYIFKNINLEIDEPFLKLRILSIKSQRKIVIFLFLFLLIGSISIYYKIGKPFINIEKLNASKEEAIQKNILDNQIIKENKEKLNQLILKSKNNPSNVSLLIDLAVTASRANNIEVEVSSLETLLILKNTPKIKSLLAQAIVRKANGQVTSKAQKLIKEALKENPLDPGANFLSGLALSQIGDEKQAFEIWVKLYKNTSIEDSWKKNLEINIKTAAKNIGISDKNLAIYLSNKKSLKAKINKEQINEIIKLNEKDQTLRINQMVEQLANRLTKTRADLDGWLRLYNAYKILNNKDKAINAIRIAVQINPDRLDLKLTLLKELLPPSIKPNFTLETKNLIIDILSLNPNNIEALFFKGLLALKKGENNDAINTWKLLLKKLPKDSSMAKEISQKINDIKKLN
jgi:cytochrome c-type biogenesis protein CcmH